jgi:mRNA-degrading endonuclease RelE of RelBE toxin-antitoxin system
VSKALLPKRSLLSLTWSGKVYSLYLMPEARDDLDSLDKPIAQRVLNRLRWLADNFEAITPEPLTGE